MEREGRRWPGSPGKAGSRPRTEGRSSCLFSSFPRRRIRSRLRENPSDWGHRCWVHSCNAAQFSVYCNHLSSIRQPLIQKYTLPPTMCYLPVR